MADLSRAFSNGTPFGLGDADYTFTEQELQDVLGYMERGQSGALDPSLAFTNPTALQFQPHLGACQPPVEYVGPVDYGRSAVMDYAAQPNGFPPIKQEVFDLMDLGALGLGPSGPAVAPLAGGTATAASGGGPSGSSSSSGAANNVPMCELASVSPTQQQAAPIVPQQPMVPVQQQQPTPRQYQAHQNSAAGYHSRKDGKPHVSHSTVEKQRRDRINSLIDELRELVPPSRHDASTPQVSDPHDIKRPKHVVLSDTIAMVKELQERLTASESQLARLREHEEHCPFHEAEEHQCALHHARHSGGGGGQHGGSCRGGEGGSQSQNSGSQNSHPELPQHPGGIGHSMDPSICVEEGEGCLYVKVSCQDRHGLLSDMVKALKSIPVEIITAAITTTRDGGVYDVFQVTPEEEGQQLSQKEVIACLQGVVEEHHTGDKRRRDT